MYFYIISLLLLLGSTGCSLFSVTIPEKTTIEHNTTVEIKEERTTSSLNIDSLSLPQKKPEIIHKAKVKKFLKIEMIDQEELELQNIQKALEEKKIKQKIIAIKKLKKEKILNFQLTNKSEESEFERQEVLKKEQKIFELKEKKREEKEKAEEIAYQKEEKQLLLKMQEEAQLLLLEKKRKESLKELQRKKEQENILPNTLKSKTLVQNKVKIKPLKKILKKKNSIEEDELKEAQEMQNFRNKIKKYPMHKNPSQNKTADEIEEEKEMQQLLNQLKTTTVVNNKFITQSKSMPLSQTFILIPNDDEVELFGTSEIHGKVILKQSSFANKKHIKHKAYLIPHKKTNNNRYTYINAINLNNRNYFSFYGLDTQVYDIVIESTNRITQHKSYIKQSVNCAKHKNTTVTFHPNF